MRRSTSWTCYSSVLTCVPRRNVIDHVRQHFLPAGMAHNVGDDLAFTLDHPEHNGLIRAAAGEAVLPAADHAPVEIGFVHFNVPVQRAVAVRFGPVLPDLVAHAPRRFVRHARLPLQLLR